MPKLATQSLEETIKHLYAERKNILDQSTEKLKTKSSQLPEILQTIARQTIELERKNTEQEYKDFVLAMTRLETLAPDIKCTAAYHILPEGISFQVETDHARYKSHTYREHNKWNKQVSGNMLKAVTGFINEVYQTEQQLAEKLEEQAD